MNKLNLDLQIIFEISLIVLLKQIEVQLFFHTLLDFRIANFLVILVW